MQLSFQNIRVLVANQDQQLSLSIKNVSFSNDTSPVDKEKDKNFSRKLAVMQGLSFDVEAPNTQKGNVIDLRDVFSSFFTSFMCRKFPLKFSMQQTNKETFQIFT